MRKFCWVYQHKKSQQFVVVQRPRFRAFPPTYRVRPYGGGESKEVGFGRFHQLYRFCGRDGTNRVQRAYRVAVKTLRARDAVRSKT